MSPNLSLTTVKPSCNYSKYMNLIEVKESDTKELFANEKLLMNEKDGWSIISDDDIGE